MALKNNKTPAITIAVTTYDRVELLKETVDSILQQSFHDFRVLIGNDCVDVPISFEILDIEADDRIEILNHTVNLGEHKNMNVMLGKCDSPWFTWLADDDILHPDFLSTAINSLQNTNDDSVIAFFSNYDSGSIIPSDFLSSKASSKELNLSPADFIQKYTNREIDLIGCYGIMNTSVIKSARGMPTLGNSFGPYSDTIIPILLSAHGRILWSDSALFFLRTHQGSISASSHEFEAYASAERDFLSRLEKICMNDVEGLKAKECFPPMVRWFADNEYAVLSRTHPNNRYSVLSKFLYYQFSVNFRRLDYKHWSQFCIYIARIAITPFVQYIKGR